MLIPLFILLLATFGACSRYSEALEMDRSGGALAPFYDSDSDAAIPDDFAVLFRPGHTLKQHFELINKDMSSVANFESFGWGYAANLSNSDHLDGVRRDSGVLGVERTVRGFLIDSVASSNASLEPEMNEVTANTIVKRGYKTDVNEDAPYGLQMLGSGRKLSTPVREIGRYDYLHGAGAGVNVYILDTGIRIGLPQFGGRARHFGGLRSTDKSPYCDDTMDDVVGHGTHVAGIVGARVVGVAPAANLINVKIANNQRQANSKQVAQALLDIIAEHKANKAKLHPDFWDFRGSIINMSFGQIEDPMVLSSQVVAAEEAGIKIYASAGNNNIDAGRNRHYPCAYPGVSCIAAVDSSYRKTYFSNYGSVVDFLAPGEQILSLGLPERDSKYTRRVGLHRPRRTPLELQQFSHPHDQWLGMVNDQTHHFADCVWWNSLEDKVSGFSGTKILLVNTGIHSKQKYPREPFRWAGDYPQYPHMVTDESLTAAVAENAESSTTFSTVFATSSAAQIASSSIPFNTASALSELATVTFSYDPESSTASATAT